MIFRQLFDYTSYTYTYLLGSHAGGEALIIDPVLEHVDRYLQLLTELDLRLVKALDTHVHADHITALGTLRDKTRCVTVMGAESTADVVSVRVVDGDVIEVDGVCLTALHTPGHTDDSYCFTMEDRVFTGDTLLIRGTGRTDFQNGNPADAYDSIFGKLLSLPDQMQVYPAHDYNGNMVSTIGEERQHNPRLQVSNKQEYVDLMNALGLAKPQMIDVAVPANQHIGLPQDELEREGRTVHSEGLMHMDPAARDAIVVVDLRDSAERDRHGVIPNSLHTPYHDLADNLSPGGLLSALCSGTGKRLVFYCAYGERSAMAVRIAQEAGIPDACHLFGGIDAWQKVGGPLEPA